MCVKVMIADDHVMIREGIKQLLEFDGDSEISILKKAPLSFIFTFIKLPSECLTALFTHSCTILKIADSSLQNLTHTIHELELASKYIDKDPIQAKLELASVY